MFNSLRAIGFFLLMVSSAVLPAQVMAAGREGIAGLTSLPSGYLATVSPNQPSEVNAILHRAEDYFEENGMLSPLPPVVMVLHGPEIDMFSRVNYNYYHSAMDLAAKLTALDVIRVRVCETQMAEQGLDRGDLLPFVETVPFGPEEEARLRSEEDFVYF